jgi:pyruvate formate lyase activating enzyme
LLALAHEHSIDTAIESTGFADFSVISRLLPHLDLYLMDIKHLNSEKHKAFTGQPNDKILENAQRIARSPVKLIIRTPVIPTFNDTEEEIRAIANFAASLPGVEEMHILPYHRIGSDKYAGLNREYTLSHIEPPSKDKMESLLNVVKGYGLKGQIGG